MKRRWEPFAVGPVVEAGVEVLGVQQEDTRAVAQLYQVVMSCCGAVTTLSQRQIVKRRRRSHTRCPLCPTKAELKREAALLAAPKPAPVPEPEPEPVPRCVPEWPEGTVFVGKDAWPPLGRLGRR